jgi:cardiolipin synthase
VVLPQHNDKAIEQDAERALYGQLNAAGVHVYEYWGRPMAHQKVATFDGKIATIGSSNLDARSLADNDEANVWTSDPKIAAQLDQELFAKDLTQSTRVTEYKPGILGRAVDELAHLFSPKL